MERRELRLAGPGRPDGYFKDKTLLGGEGHDWMGHECAILTLVVDGCLEEGFAAQRQRCASWELHYKPPGAVHTTAAGPEGVRMYILGMRPASLRRLGLESGGRPRRLDDGIVAARALAAFVEIAAGDDERHHDAGEIGRLWERVARSPRPPSTRRPAWITEVHEQVTSDPAGHAGVEALAAEFRVHPVYLARAFRRHYDATIGSVRRRARVERAVSRLSREACRLSDLALDLGYADQSHLTREFKRMTGWPPGRFRRAIRAHARPRP